jgi:hypothetical protein
VAARRRQGDNVKAETFSLPFFSIRRIETPFERTPGYKNYLAVVAIQDLPDLKSWRKINVRDPKTKGRVPNAIRESLLAHPQEFVFMNRGLVLSAEKVDISEKDKMMKVVFRDPDLHGLLDGGHTYRILMEERSNADPRQYVRVEIITGFDPDGISDLVDARNTSNQVKDQSLDNLKGKFDPIKAVLAGKPYEELISWSEYEELETGRPKPVDVRDIISFLVMLDVEAFNGAKQPLIAYKDKRACLNHFRMNERRLKKYYALLPDMLLLWDEIHENWFGWYRDNRSEEAGISGRPGGLTGINKDAAQELYFKQKQIVGRIPDAYKYPILGAFRAAIETHDGTAGWAMDPFELLKRTGVRLVGVVGNSVRNYNNPNKVGKDVGIWSSCYLILESSLRDSLNNEKEKRIKELEATLEALRGSKRSA